VVPDTATGSQETRYFLTSQALTPERFATIVRAHWGIENGLHWVLDVTLNEDQMRNRKDHGPENLALLRRLALNVGRVEVPVTRHLPHRSRRAAFPHRAPVAGRTRPGFGA
jgi:predicted transposase YbfD/YdcC